jgi:3-keto-5-aminohexanoate cleavage enzyme
MNLGKRVFLNPPEWGSFCAKAAREHGVKPEIECFDTGHIRLAQELIAAGLVDAPYLFQLCIGTHGGIGGSIKDFVFMTELLPAKNVVWTAMGVGPFQFPAAAMSILSGGHVRVGFEDNLYIAKGVLAKSNAQLVEKAVRISREFGREIAQPEDARRILGLKEA